MSMTSSFCQRPDCNPKVYPFHSLCSQAPEELAARHIQLGFIGQFPAHQLGRLPTAGESPQRVRAGDGAPRQRLT